MKKQLKQLVILAVMASFLLMPGCGKPASESPAPAPSQKVEYEFQQVYEAAKFNLGFSYPAQWEVISESEQANAITLRLRDKSDHSSSLIVLVRSGQPKNEELLKDAHTLLEKSLYLTREISQGEERMVEDRPVLFMAAEAGENSIINSKAAVFTKEGYSYLLVVVARQDDFPKIEEIFERIILETVSKIN